MILFLNLSAAIVKTGMVPQRNGSPGSLTFQLHSVMERKFINSNESLLSLQQLCMIGHTTSVQFYYTGRVPLSGKINGQ
jgi:hypothetical protein